ncbi:MAG: MFS transporter [Promethearchaeia archaeon]
MRSQIIFISVAALGIFNTYINNVLELPYFYIALMVSLSAIMGLIFTFVFGVFSDNTRSKFGRRRPYFLFGIIASIAMIFYAFSPQLYLVYYF